MNISGVGEMGVGETGVGEMGQIIGETGTSPTICPDRLMFVKFITGM